MPERIESRQVLDGNSVGDVRPETRFEHFIRVLAPTARAVMLYCFLAAILGFCGYIMLWGNEHVESFRTAAWGIISGVAGAICTKLFGGNIFHKPHE